MNGEEVANSLEEQFGELPDELSGGRIDRILTEPQQENLLEALAADAVDAAPLIGDMMTLSRMETAEEMGIEYPDRPTAVENALSDIPAPLDTIGDIIIAQNTLSYLDAYGPESDFTTPTELTDEAASNISGFIEEATPDAQN